MAGRLPKLETLSPEEIRDRINTALGGDRVTMDALIEDLAPVVHIRVARALSRRKHQAKGRSLRNDLEDLVQEVFEHLFAHDGRALRAWDAERGLSFERFVGLLAERKVGMCMRVDKRNPWTEDPTVDDKLTHLAGAEEGTLQRIESRDLLERIAEHLRQRLTPRGRQYFEMIYVERRAIADVATATGTNAQAIYAWRSRLTKMLRDLVRELESDKARDVG